MKMKKAIVVYGSTMGNTKEIAESVLLGCSKIIDDVEIKNVADIKAEDLCAYDLLLLGCSTWGDGELQDDFIEFAQDMKALDLKNSKAAVFGTGDSSYPLFCEAVDVLENVLEQCGSEIVLSGFKVDGDTAPYLEGAITWGEAAAGKV